MGLPSEPRGKIQEKGLTLVPLRLYWRRGRAKIQIGLARGKRDYDRRQDTMKREANREMERAMGQRAKGNTE